jgi:hypothetical protein
LAYEIIKRLKASKNNELIQTLKEGVQPNERVKGKKHQIFRLSLDAKEISEDRKPSAGFISPLTVLDYKKIMRMWVIGEVLI